MQLQKRKRAVIFGDFNFDLLEPDSDTSKYRSILRKCDYRLLNKINPKCCTRETPSSKSIIDHVCTNLRVNNFQFDIINSVMSDHKQIYLQIENYQPTPTKKVQYTSINYKKLYEHLENTINMIESISDYDTLEQIILDCLNKCKISKTKILNPPRQDWINKEIMHDINNRNE